MEWGALVRLAARNERITPFMVMELLARAQALESQGRSIIHMEIGEPDFPTPGPVVEAGGRALARGKLGYTPAAGLPDLRQAIADHYDRRYGVAVPWERVFVTPGASGAFVLALALLVEAGDRVLMTDPGYPCNRNFVHLYEGEPVLVPVGGDSNFHLTPEQVEAYWTEGTRGVWIASPGNPTGTVMEPGQLEAVCEVVGRKEGFILSDEIYHGLEYGGITCATALQFAPEAFVVNSFSKYFGMTGWRLGWLIVPEGAVEAAMRLIQNLFIAAPTHSQYAALAAFSPETRELLEQRRREFDSRGRFLFQELKTLGFGIHSPPQGAFYLFADCSCFADDSERFCWQLLQEGGVAVTPGADFGKSLAQSHVRFSFTTGMENLREGVGRIRRFLRF